MENKLAELGKVVREQREVLLTGEPAKTALVLPFVQTLGYNMLNPHEVIFEGNTWRWARRLVAEAQPRRAHLKPRHQRSVILKPLD